MTASFLVTAICAVVACLWFLLLALAWGDLALRRLDPEIHGLQRFVIAMLLGLGFLGYLVLAAGWIAWTPAVAWGWLVVLTLPAISTGRLARYREKIPVLRQRFHYWREQLTRFDRFLLIGLLGLFTLYFFLAFSALIGWDATTHHYVMPQRYLAAGRVVPVPEIIFGNYPALSHNLYAWAFALVGVELAGLFNWTFGVLLALLLYSFGRTLHSRTAGLIACVTFCAAPSLTWITTTGYIDLHMTAYLAAALVAWWLFVESGRSGIPWVTAILLGFALGTKHLALIYLGCLLAGRLWEWWRNQEPRPAFRMLLKEIAGLVGLALLVASPWYLRSWINAGNPIDPFLPGLFDPDYVPTNVTSIRNWAQPTLQRGLWVLITWPWRFFTDMAFIDGWYRSLTPLTLALLPLPLFLREARLRRPVGMLGATVVVYAALAFVLIPNNPRYALVAIATLSWIVGMIGGELALRPLWRIRVLPVMLLLPLVLVSVILVKQIAEVAPATLGFQPKATLLEPNFPGLAAFDWVNTNLPPEARLLSTDPRVYFLKRPFIVGDPGNESHLAPPWTLTDTREVIDHLRREGITHLLINDTVYWHPEGYYLYELVHQVEQQGLVVQTAEQASAWSRTYDVMENGIRVLKPYMTPEEARRYMHISRVDILPDADGAGNPGAVVRPDWIRRVIGGNRLPMMQGHLEALRPILTELYARDGMRVYALEWERYDAGTALDREATLTWLLLGLEEPPQIVAKRIARERELAGRIVPYEEYLRQAED